MSEIRLDAQLKYLKKAILLKYKRVLLFYLLLLSIDSNGTSRKYYKFYNIEIKIIFQCKSTKNKSEICLDAIYTDLQVF